MELVITIAIVSAAALFVVRRWIQSANRAPQPGRPAGCGGCTSCDVHAELQSHLGKQTSPPCGEHGNSDATHPSGQ